MKHVFLVHSHITNLIALQIVNEQNLSEADCVFILDRDFKSEFKNAVKNSFIILPNTRLNVRVFFWESRKQLTAFDEWISSLVNNEDFAFYTAHSNMNFFFAMISNKYCKGFYYIEEGLGSYRPTDSLKVQKKNIWIRNVLYNWNFRNRIPSSKDFFIPDHSKYLGCFGIHPLVFPEMENKIIVQPPFQKRTFEASYQHVIVLSPHVEYETIKEEDLLKSIERLLDWMIDENISHGHIKYHPAQTEDSSIKAIRKLLAKKKSKITIKEIAAPVSLEKVAVSTNARFYIILSSVGIYAALMGREVFSFANVLIEYAPSFKEKTKSIPAPLWNQIKQI